MKILGAELVPAHNSVGNESNGYYDAAVIGGGASGIMAAITAKRLNNSKNIIIIEKNDRVLKKINATGNGRCNYTNINASVRNYYGKNPDFAVFALSRFGPTNVIDFFSALGIMPLYGEDGKIYPLGGQASSVTDCLRFEAIRLNIPVVTGFSVSKIEKVKNAFRVTNNAGEVFKSKKVIVAAGGSAGRKYGTSGDGQKLLELLGHETLKPYPALVQLTTKKSPFFGLYGIKSDVSLKIVSKAHEKFSKWNGELLFTDFGLSGNAVFALSAEGAAIKNYTVEIDFLPDFSFNALFDHLKARRDSLRHLTMEHFLSGLLNKKLGIALCKMAGITSMSVPVSKISDNELKAIASSIKKTFVEVTGTKGFDYAQATLGGAITSQFNPETMESKICPGVFATGEVLDILGDCGGYNLQWAWSSGFVCGENI